MNSIASETQVDIQMFEVVRELEIELRRQSHYSAEQIEEAARKVVHLRNAFKDHALQMVANSITPMSLLQVAEALLNADARLSAYEARIGALPMFYAGRE